MLRYVHAFILLAFLPAAFGRVVVNAATTILIDTREPAPLQRAAADFADDFQRVFGQRAKIVHNPSESGASVIWITLEGLRPKQVDRPAGWERLHIQTVTSPGSGSPARDGVV